MFGWSVDTSGLAGIKKAVVIMAPHTSNWDFPIGRLAFLSDGIKVYLMIKKESFYFPLGMVLRAFGGIPVDRSHSQNTVKKIARYFDTANSFYLVITPEGTRKLAKTWKKGFYFIAQTARVPVVCGYLDYKKKIGGLGRVIHPSGDYEKDLLLIEDFYRGMPAKYPEKFSLTQ